MHKEYEKPLTNVKTMQLNGAQTQKKDEDMNKLMLERKVELR